MGASKSGTRRSYLCKTTTEWEKSGGAESVRRSDPDELRAFEVADDDRKGSTDGRLVIVCQQERVGRDTGDAPVPPQSKVLG